MSEQIPTISAVVIARNEEYTIRRCIESLLVQSVPVIEIIVVLGNSIDYTARYVGDLQRRYGRISTIVEDPDAPEHGPAAARNTGASIASGDMVLFVNGDVSVGPDYIATLLESMEASDLAATAGLRWNVRNSLVGGLMNVHYALNYNTQVPAISSPAFLSGDAMLIHADTFWNTGGFDPGMPSGEDADLGYRLRAIGAKIGYTPEATIWHEGRHYRSFGDWVKQIEWYGRGAAALARAHRWRLEREREGFKRHVLLPASMFLTLLLVAFTIGALSGAVLLLAAAVGTIVGGLKYLRAAIGVQRRCASTSLPTTPLPQDILLYPVFRFARYGLLSAFTWRALLVAGQVERERQAGGDAL